MVEFGDMHKGMGDITDVTSVQSVEQRTRAARDITRRVSKICHKVSDVFTSVRVQEGVFSLETRIW